MLAHIPAGTQRRNRSYENHPSETKDAEHRRGPRVAGQCSSEHSPVLATVRRQVMRWRMVTGVLFIATLFAGMATCAKAASLTSAYHLLPDCRKFANRDFSTATN